MTSGSTTLDDIDLPLGDRRDGKVRISYALPDGRRLFVTTDRLSAFDRIIEAGGYITAPTGGAPDANIIPIPKPVADAAMDAAACIGCGACVAACPNGAASLFT